MKRPDYNNVLSPWGDDVEEGFDAQRQWKKKKHKPGWPEIFSIRTYTDASLGRKHRNSPTFACFILVRPAEIQIPGSLCGRTQGRA